MISPLKAINLKGFAWAFAHASDDEQAMMINVIGWAWRKASGDMEMQMAYLARNLDADGRAWIQKLSRFLEDEKSGPEG